MANEITTEEIHKELDLVQGVINRMANNSFLLKGWIVSLVVIVLALSNDSLASQNPLWIGILLLVVILCFWYLDAFFLHREKCYRELYKDILKKRANNDRSNLYNLNFEPYKEQVESIWKVMFSNTLRTFYFFPLLLLTAFTVYKYFLS